MNRLILIGNGFDLAHGLKTSYKDFIFWYLDKCFNQAGIYDNGHYFEDDFLRVEVLEYYRLMDLVKNAGDMGISRYLYENKILKLYLDFEPTREYVAPDNIEKYGCVNTIPAHNVSFKSIFFKQLIYTCLDCGWVDIEQEYFDALKKFNDSDNVHDLEYIQTLNNQFAFLKSKLEEYLTLENNSFDQIVNYPLSKLLSQDFNYEDFETSMDDDELRFKLDLDHSVNESNIVQHKAYILNFNYTNTCYSYLEELRKRTFSQVAINHIHGQLNSADNPIIFGFGDEHDKDYALFEEQRNNNLFEHVKSYHYLKTPNYRDLTRFLNEGYYQVFVLGHSCGLSDRTMFKEIFDHENCKSVKIFHYTDGNGRNDFFDKTINLGRHFTDKGRMRKLIVNFNDADAVPQFENK
ncbi:hypothetical protein HMPREF0765_4068 [Sphingobacterium spiritivorum ATCC 33300]|uniref:Bacteriophage abortive infection AbiH n=1 Tax=Sphingobacterium spiritivorum ATCC 33300 TaxID=525372 RepID=C2G3B2_SPHSI|nr:AbiH family protein [Sphingobacterium spiritivorum]EEI90481.1 hypothetical protein HMPREF0765_4068 [Sphingobacterium spiritivorum ATCC 33300]QQS95237.1 hypothetical protein I6J03_17920 [Sphingobacterium spiritivorum]